MPSLKLSNLKRRKVEEANSRFFKRTYRRLHNLNDPKFKEPFKYQEWQRELVYGNDGNQLENKTKNRVNVSYILSYKIQNKEFKYKLRTYSAIAKKCKYFCNCRLFDFIKKYFFSYSARI